MKSPCLCPETVADDDALALAIDKFMLRSKTIRKLNKRVRRAQKRLRRAVDDRGWRMYMRLEQVVNHRAGDEQDALVRWAYEAGLRQR